jgi:hypothetical protein
VTEKVGKRERIMQHLLARFAENQAGEDDYTVTWNLITRKPVGRTEVGMGDAIGIFDTRESKVPDMLFMRCHLTVVFEFYCSLQMGDDPATELNRMLLDVQRTLRRDIYCSGLTLNIVETKNELDIDGPGDSLVAGVVEVQVLYRHFVDDPSV